MAVSTALRAACWYGERMTVPGHSSTKLARSKPLPADSVRSITILGATGSIGASTVDLIKREPKRYRVEAISARRNAAALAQIARDVGARLAVIADPDFYGELKAALAGSGIEAAAGEEALVEAAQRPADWVMAAISGSIGLKPTLAAIERGATVGLANKECLVCAGALFMRRAAAAGATVLPVDSEHNALFQALAAGRREDVRRLILTASGGPFRTWTLAAMRVATREQALRHPNWSMGPKVTIDSATLMNKGLELIEAHYLFGVPYERITVVISPQSTVHSMARFADGAILAHLGAPDMRTPIGYALAYPERPSLPMVKRLDLFATQLAFHKPDTVTFRCLTLAEEAGRKAAIVACDAEAAGCAPRAVAAPIVLNAANEIAVQACLDGRIAFLAIPEIVEKCLTWLGDEPVENLEDVYACDEEARRFVREAAGRPA